MSPPIWPTSIPTTTAKTTLNISNLTGLNPTLLATAISVGMEWKYKIIIASVVVTAVLKLNVFNEAMNEYSSPNPAEMIGIPELPGVLKIFIKGSKLCSRAGKIGECFSRTVMI